MTETKNDLLDINGERKSAIPERLLELSQLALLAGVFANQMTYQPNMSLGEAFLRYAVPTIGAAGLGALFEISSKLKNKESEIECLKNFNDVVNASTPRTAKFMGIAALGLASICGLTYLAQDSDYNDRLERKAKAEAIEKLPKLPPLTVVEEKIFVIKTTAQQDACGKKKFGEVEYVSPIDKNKYRVSCVGNDGAPRP